MGIILLKDKISKIINKLEDSKFIKPKVSFKIN